MCVEVWPHGPSWDDGGDGWGELRHTIHGDPLIGCLTLYPYMAPDAAEGGVTVSFRNADSMWSQRIDFDGIGDAAAFTVAANY